MTTFYQYDNLATFAPGKQWTALNATPGVTNYLTYQWPAGAGIMDQVTLHGSFDVQADGKVTGYVDQLDFGATGMELYGHFFTLKDFKVDDPMEVINPILSGADWQTQILTKLLSGNDEIIGGQYGVKLFGFGGNDHIVAGAGDDVIDIGSGSDTVDGGDRYDIALFHGSYTDFKVTRTADGYTVQNLKSGSIDTLANVEEFDFSDKVVIADSAVEGQLSRLYDLLGRSPDMGGVQFYGRAMVEWAAPLVEVADALVQSAEYQNLYGGLDNHGLVVKYYEHILGREPDQAGADFWTSALDKNLTTKADLIVALSESQEHVQEKAALIASGGVPDHPFY